MSAQAQVPSDHPLMIAWEKYKAAEDYENTRNWAKNDRHVDGSLWAAFSAGWMATHPADLQPKPAEGGAVADEYPHEAMDAIAVSRYRVVPTNSGFWPYAVRAGDGEQDLYKGHEKACMVVAQRLAGAFLDGGLVGFDLWRHNAAFAPAGSGEADYECRAHACRRVRVEMQAEISRLRAGSGEAVATGIVGWIHEDQLPDGYPYEAMFRHSKVDGVRMFPVFAPAAAAEALSNAASTLVRLVEGPGCLRWEDGSGSRLKDTTEWCAFYCAARRLAGAEGV